MDPINNPLQRILDLTQSEHNLHSLINIQNSHLLDSYPLFFNHNDSKNNEKYDFLLLSPNPFKHQRKNSSELAFQFKNHCSSNQYHINRKLLLDQDENFSKWNFIDRESQFPFNNENANMFKKSDSFQFSIKQKIQSQQKKISSFQDFKLSKNERGLKSLSQIIYEMLKKNDNLTLNIVAQQLVEKFRSKYTDEGSVLQESAEKNIRRRTYDALNVLISAGIVQKKGKTISIRKREFINMDKNNLTNNRMREVTKREAILEQLQKELQQRIVKREMILRKKQQQYESLMQRKRNIEKFFEKKKQQECEKVENELEKTNNKNSLRERIDFPFLCIKTTGGNLMDVSESASGNKRMFGWQKDNSSTCDQYNNKQQSKVITLHFSSKSNFQPITLQGDVDFISNLGHMIVANGKKQQSN